jgi:methylmalonyl-CoA/ethylmalonyl-CoA epimerase
MSLGQLGQIALAISDPDRSEAFYETTLGLRKLYRYGPLVFFDCAGVRLMLSPPEDGRPVVPSQGALYFRVPDLVHAMAELEGRGAAFSGPPHLIANMPDHDLWMADLRDPDGHVILLMMEAPKGYAPTPPPDASQR